MAAPSASVASRTMVFYASIEGYSFISLAVFVFPSAVRIDNT
jgi:hypothetical protein